MKKIIRKIFVIATLFTLTLNNGNFLSKNIEEYNRCGAWKDTSF